MLQAFNRRLADDAHDAWKWGSMRFIALGGVLQGAVIAADRTGISAHIPDWIMGTASSGAFLSFIAAGVSRVTTSTKDKPDEPA